MSVWRPSTTTTLVGGVVLVIIAAAVAFIVVNFQPKTEVKLGDGIFHLRVASDQTARELGLSGVGNLQPDEGLLMVFDSKGKWGIWMKDMKIPIDIIWLDDSKQVVTIVKNVSPDLLTNKVFEPTQPARYVIELSAGAVQENHIKAGDTATFQVKGGNE